MVCVCVDVVNLKVEGRSVGADTERGGEKAGGAMGVDLVEDSMCVRVWCRCVVAKHAWYVCAGDENEAMDSDDTGAVCVFDSLSAPRELQQHDLVVSVCVCCVAV